MDTYFIVLSVQTGAAYSHLYYITYPSLSCEVWNTVQRHDVIACHYFETWGKSGRTRILPVALYFSVFSRAVFLEIGIFTRSA